MKRKILFLVIINSITLGLVLGNLLFQGHYIQHADFTFDVDFWDYFFKNRYLWNEVYGSLALDTNIRFFSRLHFLLFNVLFRSNILLSYYFAIYHNVVIYLGGYVLLNYLLRVPRKYAWWLSLFFVFNPPYLGNFSKIGLVYGCMLSPLIIASIKRYFETSKYVWLVFVNILINFSFIHPFNFILNLLCGFLTMIYFLWDASYDRMVVIKHIIISVVVGISLNLYFLLAIFSMNAFDKNAISNSSGASGEANFLLDIANTKSMGESFALTKSVFVEYAFHTDNTKWLYFAAFLLIYLMLFYILQTRSYIFTKTDNRILFSMLLGLFLTFLLSSGAYFEQVLRAYTVLQSLPGGWAFRSPLKWQLYQPLLLFGILGILYKYMYRLEPLYKNFLIAITILLAASNTYVVYEVWLHLLVPDTYHTDLKHVDFKNKRYMFQNDVACRDVVDKNREYMDEIKHLVRNQAATFKLLSLPELFNNTAYFQNFDYVVVCEYPSADILNHFDIHTKHEDPEFYLLENKQKVREDIYTIESIAETNQWLTYENIEYLENENLSIADGHKVNFYDALAEHQYLFGAEQLTDVYTDTVDSYKNLELNYVYDQENRNIKINYRHNGILTLGGEVVFGDEEYALLETVLDSDIVTINGEEFPLFDGRYSFGNFDPTSIYIDYVSGLEEKDLYVELPQYKIDDYDVSGKELRLDSNMFAPNLIRNPSFEKGLWKEGVDDCFNYDDEPKIGMELQDEYVTDGDFGMRIYAKRHIACTSQVFDVSPNYALAYKLDAMGYNDAVFDFTFLFNNEAKTQHRFRYELNGPETFEGYIQVPKDATEVQFYLKSPQVDPYIYNTVYVDNIFIYEEPNRTNMYYYENLALKAGGYVTNVSKTNPTYYNFTLHAKNDVLVVFEQDYNPYWVVTLGGEQLGQQFRHNYLYNGYKLNILDICEDHPDSCRKGQDGFAVVDLTVEFAPQALFDKGLMFSWVAFTLATTYCIWVLVHGKHKKDPDPQD